MLHKIRFSYRKPRPVPYNSAPEAEQEEFKRRTSAEVGRLIGHECAVFSEDEALRRLSAVADYGWFPTNGNETVPTGFSTRCVRMFGILGKDGHHVQTAEATNSRTFVDFLKWVLLKYPKFVLVLDNASYHKSGTVMTIWRTSTGTSVWYSCPRTRRSSTQPRYSGGRSSGRCPAGTLSRRRIWRGP